MYTFCNPDMTRSDIFVSDLVVHNCLPSTRESVYLSAIRDVASLAAFQLSSRIAILLMSTAVAERTRIPHITTDVALQSPSQRSSCAAILLTPIAVVEEMHIPLVTRT
jgi:hypothetical protein